eukprot:GFYU01003107.1.p1 GENE.GFYU01003107.1~~GFYU01003107.1.p1  ORF type:complete len:471 (-),score=144.83 GFYU01003107.1:138-1508(-)
MKTLLVLALCVTAVLAFPQEDKVDSLPGVPDTPGFDIYSGYLDVPNTKKHLHYFMTMSQGNPDTDPLVLWLNGGPGCSSLDGMFSENGAYLAVGNGENLESNPHAWNKIANVVYIESPVGVGFSYSDDESDLTIDDHQTAHDALEAVLHLFEKFPSLRKNEFFVVGESYGGIYVPMLVEQIQIYNKKATQKINLKAFGVGNGLSSYELNDNSLVDFAYSHGLVSDEDWAILQKECHGDYHSPPSESVCAKTVARAMQEVYAAGANFYDLYRDCASSETYKHRYMLKHLIGHLGIAFETDPFHTTMLQQNVPCIDSDAMTKYLNRPEVQQALHIKPHLPVWNICSDVLNYQKTVNGSVHLYPKLLEDYRAMVYNGDTDMACNFLGDSWMVSGLKRPRVNSKNRRGWKVNGQVAGWVDEYDKITYLTVKGAGHMVPQWKPVEAFVMFQHFLEDKPLPP